MRSESEDEGIPLPPLPPAMQNIRSRFFQATARDRDMPRPISTTPGMGGAGETETETDEPSRHLPTARIPPPHSSSLPLTREERIFALLFAFARLLAIIPAVFGTLYNLYHVYAPPPSQKPRPAPQRVDFFVSALWAILTGYQCLALATGLLARWRAYYPPLSTLVRLLALQGICWPATHVTLTVLRHEVRPVMCWAVIGTTTCMSRSVQMWVTSNLWWDAGDGDLKASAKVKSAGGRRSWKRWGGGGKWGGRRWDWAEVGVKASKERVGDMLMFGFLVCPLFDRLWLVLCYWLSKVSSRLLSYDYWLLRPFLLPSLLCTTGRTMFNSQYLIASRNVTGKYCFPALIREGINIEARKKELSPPTSIELRKGT